MGIHKAEEIEYSIPQICSFRCRDIMASKRSTCTALHRMGRQASLGEVKVALYIQGHSKRKYTLF
jgi:hypothetical protein